MQRYTLFIICKRKKGFLLRCARFFVTLSPKFITKMKRIINQWMIAAGGVMLLLLAASCTNKKFCINGDITDAADSTLYLEHMSLNGAIAIDSVKLDETGHFSFSGEAPEAPDFYRLRIGGQIINVAIDSTEQICIKASYPTMTARYEVTGSQDCEKIQELAQLQLALQSLTDNIASNMELNYNEVSDSIQKVLNEYKESVKLNYIFKEPAKAYAYFALFQTVRLGNMNALIFNPRTNEQDVKVFAAVATSWDSYYPDSERGKNLHNIAIEGMKNIRILRAQREQTINAEKVSYTGVLDIALPDNRGAIRHLNAMTGQVVLLDFHVFSSEESTARVMQLRELYNKYHARGFEIFQVSLDPDEHFWKTSTAALPWICVRDENSLNSKYLQLYNVQGIPTFYLIDKTNTLYKRDAQVKDLDKEIEGLL